MKSPQPSYIPFKDEQAFSRDKIGNVKSIIDSSITEFNKKYAMISNILNEMKSEFLGQMTSVMEYLSSRKEQPNDYNTNTGMESNPSSSALQTFQTEVNEPPHKRINDYTSMAALRKSSINQFNEKTKVKKVVNHDNKTTRNKAYSITGKANYPKMNSYALTYSRMNSNQMPTDNKGRRKSASKFVPPSTQITLTKVSKNESFLKGISILYDSKVLDFNDKVKLKYLNKDTYNQISLKEITKDIGKEFKPQFKLTNRKYPSLTAQLGINFMTEEKQNKIINTETDFNKKIIEILYMILDDENNYNKTLTSKELYIKLFKKNNVNNIKDIFQLKIFPQIFINKSFERNKWKALTDLYSKYNKDLIDISKQSNNDLFLISFSLIEIYEFLSLCFNVNN